MNTAEIFDAVVIGGGPAGATAAQDLARRGRSVLLLDRAGRIKPCGGAIPPRLIKDFAIPDELLVAKARSARMISPKDRCVDIPIEDGFVGGRLERCGERLRPVADIVGTVGRQGEEAPRGQDRDGALDEPGRGVSIPIVDLARHMGKLSGGLREVVGEG